VLKATAALSERFSIYSGKKSPRVPRSDVVKYAGFSQSARALTGFKGLPEKITAAANGSADENLSASGAVPV